MNAAPVDPADWVLESSDGPHKPWTPQVKAMNKDTLLGYAKLAARKLPGGARLRVVRGGEVAWESGSGR